MITAEEVKARLNFASFYTGELRDLKPGTNGNAMALCPFHEDKKPSLSVNLETGYFHCFGCGAEGDVFDFYQKRHGVDFKTALQELARLAGLDPDAEDRRGEEQGLTLEAFAEAKRLPIDFLQEHGVIEVKGGNGRPYVVFEYRGLGGKVIPEANRLRFSMAERPIAKRGGKPALYGLWRQAELLAEEGELLLVEGESDALTAWLYGLPAVGVPGKTLLKTLDPQFFQAFRSLYVWEEPDAEGWAQEVAGRLKDLPGLRVFAMTPPPGIKDLSEAHCRGMDILALVRQMQREAVEVITLQEEQIFISAFSLLSQHVEPPDNIISGGILPRGGGLIIAGESGDGKSLLRLQLAISLATSLQFLDFEIRKSRVLIIQSENTQREETYRLRRMLIGLGLNKEAIMDNILFLKPSLRFYLNKSKSALELEKIIKDSGADVVIYDPLTSFHNVNENDNVAIRQVLDTITQINRSLNTTAIVIHHFGKPSEFTTNAYRTRGASSIKDWADTLITLTRKNHEHKILRLLEFLKVRNGPEPKSLLLERDEFFLHHITEAEMLCPPEKVAEIIQNQGGTVEGFENLKQLISQTVNCSPRAAATFIKTAKERGFIKVVSDPQDSRKKIYVAV
uniref:Zinc finger CHC2-type domain-containing protein n=1 Tax=Desulfobacca acetoxidans TaxID=60893 RepID=A0A7C5AM47_9BACT